MAGAGATAPPSATRRPRRAVLVAAGSAPRMPSTVANTNAGSAHQRDDEDDRRLPEPSPRRSTEAMYATNGVTCSRVSTGCVACSTNRDGGHRRSRAPARRESRSAKPNTACCMVITRGREEVVGELRTGSARCRLGARRTNGRTSKTRTNSSHAPRKQHQCRRRARGNGFASLVIGRAPCRSAWRTCAHSSTKRGSSSTSRDRGRGRSMRDVGHDLRGPRRC